MRNKWKIRVCGGCLSVDRLDNSLSVSLPSWGWVTGRVLHHIKLHNSNWRHLHQRREKREDIVLRSLIKRERLHSSLFAMWCRPQSWGEFRGYLDFLKLAPIGGHTGIPANKAPCQPEMHNLEIGKLLKAFQSKNVMFCGALWPARCNLKKISWKMKGGDNPIKARQSSLTLEQVPLHPCH